MPSGFQPKPIPEPLWDGKEETRLTYWNKKLPPSLPYALGTPIFPLEKLKLIDFSNKRKALTPVDQMTLGELEAQDYEMINFLDGKMTNYKEIRERYSETPRYCSICTEHAGKHFHEGEFLEPVCHNHSSSLARRVEQELDEFGQYLCLECAPKRSWHGVRQAERYLVCATSSVLNNWMTAAVNIANCDYEGTRLHIDWEGVSGATVKGLKHAVSATYENSRKPIDMLVVAGCNDLVQGRSVEDIMRDLMKFKKMVLEICPRHFTGKSSFAVATPPLPPKYTRLDEDFHELGGVDLTDKYMELVQRIIIMNEVSDAAKPGIAYAPQFHKFGVHSRITTVWDRYLLQGRYRLRKIPCKHRYGDWRERDASGMVHLNEKKRVAMGMAVATYFERLHQLQ